MGTSKSNKQLKACIGGALIFSGRPDPTWQVEEAVVQKLEKIWILLEPWAGEQPSAPPLGYRGCFLRCKPYLEWIAYGGVVTLKTFGRQESRRDKDRNFEKLLLDSAPEGVLPVKEIFQKS